MKSLGLQNQINELEEVIKNLCDAIGDTLTAVEILQKQVKEQGNYITYLQSKEDKTVCTQ